jgi:hypothetical protein
LEVLENGTGEKLELLEIKKISGPLEILKDLDFILLIKNGRIIIPEGHYEFSIHR